MKTSHPSIAQRLDTFFNLFEPSIQLAEELIATRSHSQEVVLLLCARLDALASCISPEDQPNRQSFIRLLVNYSGHRDLMQSVSAGDLYYELGFHRWFADSTLPAAGRLVRYSRIDDPIIELLERSGIPLTAESARRLLTRLMRIVAANFRCWQRQPRRKPTTAKARPIIDLIIAEVQRDVTLRDTIEDAIKPLLESKTIAALIYEKVRNDAVHGLKVDFDEESFFREQQPYWEPLYSEHFPSFMFVKFPAHFLIRVLRNCIVTVKNAMLAKGKLPPDVFFHTFGLGSENRQFLKYLDYEMLASPIHARFQRR